MKSWLARFRVSSAFDDNRPLPGSLRRQLEKSEELRTFARRISELDSALRKSSAAEAPDTVHRSIMRAVRTVERAERPAQARAGSVRWLPASALALCVVCALWWFSHWPAANRSLPSPGPALEVAEQMAQSLPAQVMDPLQEELRRVNHDVDDTTRFLLASVPF
jgi:hypothetical protein